MLDQLKDLDTALSHLEPKDTGTIVEVAEVQSILQMYIARLEKHNDVDEVQKEIGAVVERALLLLIE